jgi:3-methyladenine DNA glycosylase AlkD
MRSMMATVENVLRRLKERANPDNLEGMVRFGITIDHRLGVSVPEMRKMAKEFAGDHRLALELWKTGIDEARILSSMIDDPEQITQKQGEKWVKDFNSWDVCDQVCMNLFRKTPWAYLKIIEWAGREEEFIKRAAFSLMACLACHDKKTPDENFIKLFSLLRRGATDERNFVRKAVNWALRNIGKRNPRLNRAAIQLAEEIGWINSKTARWIASDAIRELKSNAVQQRLKNDK